MNQTKRYYVYVYDRDCLVYTTTIYARNLDYALDISVTELEKNFPKFATGNKVILEEVK